VPTRTKT